MYLVQAHRLKRKLPPMTELSPAQPGMARKGQQPRDHHLGAAGGDRIRGRHDSERRRPRSSERIALERSGDLELRPDARWLVAAAAFNAVYRPARRGRKVAYLTVVSFVFLVVALGVLLLVDTQHGGSKTPRTGGGRPGA